MSAQVTDALRERAAALKAEAHALQHGTPVPPGPDGRPRFPEHLMLIADEFQALARVIEGYEPLPEGEP